jgi:hypothetical protein
MWMPASALGCTFRGAGGRLSCTAPKRFAPAKFFAPAAAWVRLAHAKFVSFVLADDELSTRELSAVEVCAAQVAVGQVRAVQKRARQVRVAQVGADEARVTQVGARKRRALQIGKRPVDAGQDHSFFANDVGGPPPQPRFRGLLHKVHAGEFRHEVRFAAMLVPMKDAIFEQPAMLLRGAKFSFGDLCVDVLFGDVDACGIVGGCFARRSLIRRRLRPRRPTE